MHLRTDILAWMMLMALSINSLVACEKQTQQAKKTKPSEPTKQTNVDLLENVRKLKDAADVSKEVGDWASALKYRLKVYDLYKKIYQNSPDHIDLANCLSELGEAYSKTEKNQEALDSYLQSLRIMRNVFKGKPYKPETATVLFEIGDLYRNMGNNTEAIKYYSESLDIVREADQPDNVLKIRNLDKLARSYKSLQDYPNAIKYATETYEAIKTIHRYEPHSRDVRTSLNLLLSVLRDDEQYEKALTYSKIWHEMLIEEFYENSLVAFSYFNLGFLHYKLENYLTAILSFRQALRIYPENEMDDDDAENLAEVNFYMARCYYQLSDYQSAIKYMTEALEMYDHINKYTNPGSHSNNIYVALEALGIYYMQAGNNKKGKEYYLAAADFFENLDENAKDDVGGHTVYTRLGQIASVESDHYEAIRYYSMAVDGFQKKGEDESVAFWLARLAKEYIKTKKYADALRCGLKTLELQKKINADNLKHPEIAMAHDSLAKVYIEMGIPEKALDHQRQAANMCSEFYFNKEHNDFCVKALSSLGKIYSDMDDEDSALRYYSEAKRISGKFEDDNIVFHSRTPPKQDL